MGHLPALFAGGRPFFDGQNNSNYFVQTIRYNFFDTKLKSYPMF